jgi:NAD(P)H-dependent FMN reductase
MGASTGRGGTIRAQLQLRQAFLYTGVCALLQPELMVDHAHERFSAAGRLEDPMLRDRLARLLAALAEWTRRLGGAASPAPAVLQIAFNGNGASPAPHAAGEAVLQPG